MGEELINNKNQSPKYIQLREILRSRIEEGVYLPGTAIPSESELVDEFGIHRLTVRNAINSLTLEGQLKPVQGKGVFVVGKKIRHELDSMSGFRQKIREQGGTSSVKMLNKVVRPAGAKFARLLEIQPEDEIFFVRRLYSINGEPYSIEDVYIPKALLPDLEFMDLEVFSLFDIMEFHGHTYDHGWQTLTAYWLDAKDARWLKIDPGTPVLMFECVTRNKSGKVIEYNQSFTRSEKAAFSVNFSTSFKNEYLPGSLKPGGSRYRGTEPLLVGVDLGATNIRAGLVTQNGEALDVRSSRLGSDRREDTGARATIELVETLLKENGSPGILGIGVGATGPVDPCKGTILSPYTSPAWQYVPYTGLISAHFGLPCVLENDADAAALAEYWQGAGKGVKRLLAVTVGTGIGTALLIDGRIYRGMDGAHPEAGHHIIDPSGPLCYCGAKGCWESLASGDALTEYSRQIAAEDPQFLRELSLSAPELVTGAAVAKAAERGSAKALAVMQREARYLAVGLLNLISAYVPEMIVLSGGVIENYALLRSEVEETMRKNNLMVPADKVRIIPAKLGYYSGVIGGAYALLLRLQSEEKALVS